ncbi:MAG: peptidoglycan-associated lipoprotein Pal [Nitrospinae bacterium]|nr:peptidoglycan-associated lipoprotein Pal [Nitrospinota bacterium]
MNKFKMAVAAIFIMFLSTACSKKLMPPEISSSSEGVESSDFTASDTQQEEGTFGGSGGPGDSGLFSEEPILESGGSGGAGTSSGSGDGRVADNSSGSATGPGGTGGSAIDNFGSSGEFDIGNGSTGAFDGNPFAGSGGDGSGSGDQMARLNSTFQESSDLKDIHFKFDKYDLDSNSKKVLQQNAEFLKKNPGMKIEVQGHCDERGTNNYNIALGERRAHSTKKFLESLGIDASRLNTISYGEEKPFCFDSNENCWFQNRRAHFMVSK